VLSVVVPVHNEVDNLVPLVTEVCGVLRPSGIPFELIIVDDGSADGSDERLARLLRDFAELRVERLPRRRGQTTALWLGLHAAGGEWIATMDGDLQNDARDLLRLLEHGKGHDAVVGVRSVRHDPWSRRVSSRIANAVRGLILNDEFYDVGCPVRVMRRRCVAAIPPLEGMHRFVPTLLRIHGCRVAQVPVSHRPRGKGRSKYGVWNRLLPSLSDLLGVRWMIRRRIRLDRLEDRPER
jgi:glycosyltransferase involved in cell wall biosynthesis